MTVWGFTLHMCQGLELLELNWSHIILHVLFNDTVKLHEKHLIFVFSVVCSPRKGDYSGHGVWLISEVYRARKRQQTIYCEGNSKKFKKITRWGWSNSEADCGNSTSGNLQNRTGDPNNLSNSWDLPHFKQAVAIQFRRSLSIRITLWQEPQCTDLAGHCTSGKLLLIWNGKDFALRDHIHGSAAYCMLSWLKTQEIRSLYRNWLCPWAKLYFYWFIS